MTTIVVYGQTTTKSETIEIIGERPEIPASYPGGFTALNKYINENVTSKLTFTKEEATSLRKAFAKFTIDENGNVVNVKIAKSSNIPQLDSLLVVALRKMPKWTPAKNTVGGKTIKQDYTFPLTICLK